MNYLKKIGIFAWLFLLKTTYAQNIEWTKSLGGSSNDLGTSISVDDLGNVFTTGVFLGTVDFDPGAGTTNLTSVGTNDVFVQKIDASGNFLWAKSFGSTSNDIGYSISLDALGNVYTTGFFSETVDFDPGTGTYNLTSAGDRDIFVHKMDASGNFLWVKSFGGSAFDVGKSLVVDALGNVYTTGSYSGTVDFDPGTGTSFHTSIGINDVFVHKMDASGNFLWAKSFGGTTGDYGHSIVMDAVGNVYTTGIFYGTVDFDPGTGISNHTSSGSSDIFVHKMDASGNFLWAKSFGGTSGDWGLSISLDDSANVYTTGYFQGTANFDTGTGIFNHTSLGNTDVFVHKMDASGNFLWAKALGGSSEDKGSSVSVDAAGNIYTAGHFQGTVDFDPGAGVSNYTSAGSRDAFVHKMDAAGNFIWVQALGSTSFDVVYAMTVDAAANIYSLGYFEGTVDFDPGAGIANHTAVGGWDIFVQKISITNVGIIENSLQSKFVVYPNPTSGLISIEFISEQQSLEVNVLSISGKILQTKQVNNSSLIELNIMQSNGVYLVEIVDSDNKKAMLRIIKK